VSDQGLPEIFRDRMPQVDWQRIETGAMGPGTPDLNGCLGGTEVWVECKATFGWTLASLTPQQNAWLSRRSRKGGRCFVAVRQLGRGRLTRAETGGRIRKRDSLWIFSAEASKNLLDGIALDAVPPDLLLGWFEGGPANWDWKRIERVLFRRRTRSE
jgi:hypothetical protein